MGRTADALTQLCVDAETEFVGAPTGGMDQAVALRAEAGHALLLDCHDGAADRFPSISRPRGSPCS